MYKFTKFDIANMNMAYITASLSYAQRRKVGAIIVDENRIIANGYNGTITGTDNSCEDLIFNCVCGIDHIFKENVPSTKLVPSEDSLKQVPVPNKESLNLYIKESHYDNVIWYKKECSCGKVNEFTYNQLKLKTNNRVIHAEQNALLFAARKGISVKGATMYVTSAPCIECAKAIAESGIKRVIWKEVYKDLAGPDLLNEVDVECIRYDVVEKLEWESK